MDPRPPRTDRIVVVTSSDRLREAPKDLWAGARTQLVVVGCRGLAFTQLRPVPEIGYETWPRCAPVIRRAFVMLRRGWSHGMASAWNAEAAARVTRLAREGATVVLDGEHLVTYASGSGVCCLVPNPRASRRERRAAAGVSVVLDADALSGGAPLSALLDAGLARRAHV